MVPLYACLVSMLIALKSCCFIRHVRCCITYDPKSLKLLHVISRHGARNPAFFYPTDPHKNHEYFGGIGALTNLGKQQQYMIGKFLKERYCDFLTSNPKEVHARSSQSERTIESALSALAGLYPPEGYWKWNENLLWQPIPVYSTPRETDYLLHYNATCPIYSKELHRYRKTKAVREYYDLNKSFLEFLSEKTGMEILHLYQVLLIHSTLEIEKQLGLSLPSWAEEEVLEKMRKIAIYNFRFLYGTTTLKTLRGGPLVKEIVGNIQKKLAGSLTQTKLFWYSTHDAILAAFMNALHIYNKQLPPFSATIIVEFHSSESKHFLRIFYANSTTPEKGRQELHQLHIPGCDSDCSLETFSRLTAYITSLDLKKQCFEE